MSFSIDDGLSVRTSNTLDAPRLCQFQLLHPYADRVVDSSILRVFQSTLQSDGQAMMQDIVAGATKVSMRSRLTVADVRALGVALKTNVTLVHLSLENCGVGDDGAA